MHYLQAGQLRASIVGTELRHVYVGKVQVVQRLYVAVRDAEWNTVPGVIDQLSILNGPDYFSIELTVRHVGSGVDFSWTGQYTGNADGQLACSMEGTANRAFSQSRIGFNVHLPLESYVGRPFQVVRADGPTPGRFPLAIAPQLIRDGFPAPMVPHFDRLDANLSGGVSVRFDFGGVPFEIEDHRNWCDANFKVYGPPLEWGFPTPLDAGALLHQDINIAVDVAHPVFTPTRRPLVEVRVGEASSLALPQIGFGLPTPVHNHSRRELSDLRFTRPDHLRVDVQPAEGAWHGLDSAAKVASHLATGLEVAVFLGEDPRAELATLAARLADLGAPTRRVLVFEGPPGLNPFARTTPPAILNLSREIFGQVIADTVEIVGGTSQFFANLNRDRPHQETTDAVAFSLNPQVHVCDDVALMENLAAEKDVIDSVRALYPRQEIVISRVTLIGPYGPYPAGSPEDGGLPGKIDVRQADLFGAAWTMGSVKGLTAAGVTSLTYYETVGWAGIVEADEGCPRPDLFPSQEGGVHPLYHVFADLAEWKQRNLLLVSSSDEVSVQGMAVEGGEFGRSAMLANLSAEIQVVSLRGLKAERVSVRTLDSVTHAYASASPHEFRSEPQTIIRARGGSLHLTLLPYAYVLIMPSL